jgi:hypothetical protein
METVSSSETFHYAELYTTSERSDVVTAQWLGGRTIYPDTLVRTEKGRIL